MGKMKDKPSPLANEPIMTAREREVRRFVRACIEEKFSKLKSQLATKQGKYIKIKSSQLGVTEYIVVNGVTPTPTFHDGGGVLTLSKAEDTETPACSTN